MCVMDLSKIYQEKRLGLFSEFIGFHDRDMSYSGIDIIPSKLWDVNFESTSTVFGQPYFIAENSAPQ